MYEITPDHSNRGSGSSGELVLFPIVKFSRTSSPLLVDLGEKILPVVGM